MSYFDLSWFNSIQHKVFKTMLNFSLRQSLHALDTGSNVGNPVSKIFQLTVGSSPSSFFVQKWVERVVEPVTGLTCSVALCL